MSTLFTGGVDGIAADVTQYNANWNLLESSLLDLGPSVISGLAVTVGTGLSVNVALGVASIGGRVNKAGTFTIGGLTPSTTNHLYLLIDGTGTANTSGTAPANSVKLGTCLTDGSSVLSVAQTRASGRQAKVRLENVTLGGGAGQPAAGDLSSWHASNTEGNQFRGALPDGALSANVALLNVTNTFLAAQVLKVTDAATNTAPVILTIEHRGGAPVAGYGATLAFASDNGSNGLVTTGTIGSFYTVQTAGSESTRLQFKILYGGPVTEVMSLRAVGTASAGGVGGELTVFGDLNHAGTLLGFYGATTVAKPGSTADLRQALINLGLYTTGGATPLNLNGGALTASGTCSLGATTHTGDLTLSTHNLVTDTVTGTQLGTGATQKLGHFGATPIVQPANTTDLKVVLTSLGLLASGGVTPLNIGAGALTAGVTALGATTVTSLANSGTYGGSGAAFTMKRFALTFPSDADYTLAAGEYDALWIDVQVGVITATRNVIVPVTAGALYIIRNNNTRAVVIKTSGGTGITIAAGRAAIVMTGAGTNYSRLTPDVDFTL